MTGIDKIKNPFFNYFTEDQFKKIVSEYTSPVFLYSKNVIKDQYSLLSDCLPRNYKIFFAQKSNPHPEILKLLNSLGAGCDTASKGEINAALQAGFPKNKIMMTGPGKTQEELELSVEKELLSVNVESLQEAELLNKICNEKNKIQNILIRINPGFEAGESNRIIGGMGISKFGIDIDQLPIVIEKIKALSNLNIKGIHIFNSSQILDWKKIFESTKNVIRTAIEIQKKYNIKIESIDLGGGFGIPYSNEEDLLDASQLGKALKDLVKSSEYNQFLADVKLVYEPGRFLTGQSGIYITKVLYTKNSGGKNIAIIDGGIHHLVRPALIDQDHKIINLTGLFQNRSTSDSYLVAGPLCTSLDQFTSDMQMSEVHPGDLLAVLNAGAYGYTESMPLFLSHAPAREIFID